MAVMARETWTDERLDDLAAQTDKRFDRVDADIRGLRTDMNKGFDRVDTDVRELRAEMKRGFMRVDDKFDNKFDSLQSEMNARFESMQRTMIIGFVTLFAGIVASVIGVAFAA